MRSFYYRNFMKYGIRRGFYNDAPVVETPPPNADDDKPTLSQKKVNDLLAAERRKAQEANKKTVEELEKVKATAGLSEERVTELQKQIGELEKTYMSQAELAKREADKQANEYKTRLEKAEQGTQFWQGNFQKHLVKSEITSAAAQNEAYNPEQMLTQLGGLAKVVPITLDGKETGDFEVKIQFPDTTKEGQRVVLELTPDAAMKRMKELPDKYGNLFKNGTTGGVGGGNNGPTGGGTDLNSIVNDPEKYRANRAKLLK